MSFSAVVFRAAAYETPLWSFPNIHEGRWNRPGSWPAQYLAFHPMTPWAEMLRNLDLQDPQDAREMRLAIWTTRIELEEDPLDVHFSDAPGYSLDPSDLVGDDRSACQALAARLVAAGTTSITVPSAALPGTRNLVVFAAAVVIDYEQRPLDRLDWPTAMLAQDGRSPEGLWAKVHYRAAGVPHRALDAFLAGDDYELEQPLARL